MSGRRELVRFAVAAVAGVAAVMALLVASRSMFSSGSALAVERSSSSPLSVVQGYLAALDRHDGAGVCRWFAPQLRAYELRVDAPPGVRTCASTVSAHFHGFYSDHHWVSARIAGKSTTTVDEARQIAAVDLTLVHHYVCAKSRSPRQPCHPGMYRRPDVVYLIRRGSSWAIIKPGLVYYATTNDMPTGAESDYYPPGDATTIARPAKFPAPAYACPRSRTRSVSAPHKLTSPSVPNPAGPGTSPWLNIHALAVSRISSRTLCFTLGLGAPPQPDSAYQIYTGRIQQAAAADLFDVEIDGLGNPHPLLVGSGALSSSTLASDLPKVFLIGSQLEIIARVPAYAPIQRFLLTAASESIQSEEPLLTHPLDAGDRAPQRGCLTFPTGKLDTHGLCGEQPSG
jgi:hypothetical protein